MINKDKVILAVVFFVSAALTLSILHHLTMLALATFTTGELSTLTPGG